MDEHTSYEQAYKNGYEKGKQDAMKWISVKERLPEEEGWYWVFTTPDRGYKSVNKSYFVKYNPWEKTFDPHWHGAGGTWTNVNHWMPLPEPPKGE